MALIRSGNPANLEQVIDAAGNSRVRQELPAGAVLVQFTAIFTATAAEGLVTLTPTRDYVAGATGTSMPVTAGKRLRLINFQVAVTNAAAAAQGVQVRLRINPTGAAVIGSPLVAVTGVGASMAIAGVSDGESCDLTGIELAGAAQLAVGQLGSATAGNAVVVTGYEF